MNGGVWQSNRRIAENEFYRRPVLNAAYSGTSPQDLRDEAEGNRILGKCRRDRLYSEIELQNIASDNRQINSVCIGIDNGISISRFYGQ